MVKVVGFPPLTLGWDKGTLVLISVYNRCRCFLVEGLTSHMRDILAWGTSVPMMVHQFPIYLKLMMWLFFAMALANPIRSTWNFWKKYYKLTGLEIDKEIFFFSTGATNSPRDTIIQSLTGFHKKDLPLEYLGCPFI